MRAAARVLAIALGCWVGIALSDPDEGAAQYVWRLPPGFPVPAVPADNPMSEAKVALGCRLFSETRLSATHAYSCASCHRAERAFTDGRALALGAKGASTPRGAMTLTNVAYNPAFTWASERVVTLERQMEQPLFNEHPLEMGLRRDDRELVEWLSRQPDYASAFRASFPQEAQPVSIPNVIKAIASFERTLISGRSPFDRYVYDDDRTAFSPAARRGMRLFYSDRSGCARCHFGVNFSGPVVQRGKPAPPALFANNGSAVQGDEGLSAETQRQHDRGRFRVPTLRNVALTAPYMHDGRFATLEQVIDHYAAGGRHAQSLGVVDSQIRPLDLSAQEKRDLVEFLDGLTDTQFAAPRSCQSD
ncbi:MAG TPA: di-heme enzyme [Steroidobacteraceae bacterium]|nr:di-heme enzyme [Steroidobacteraceae bacterium]